MAKLSFIFVLVVFLVGCGTARDFVRPTETVRDYERDFSESTWSYQEYLVSQSGGFRVLHDTIGFQWAVSSEDEQRLSIVFQTYSHQLQHQNSITVVVDGRSFTFEDIEPIHIDFPGNRDFIERHVVEVNEEFVTRLLSADAVTFEYVTTIEVANESLKSIKDFIRSESHIAMM